MITASQCTSQKFALYNYFSKLNTFSLRIGLIFFIKTCGNVIFFGQRTAKRISYQILENTNIG